MKKLVDFESEILDAYHTVFSDDTVLEKHASYDYELKKRLLRFVESNGFMYMARHIGMGCYAPCNHYSSCERYPYVSLDLAKKLQYGLTREQFTVIKLSYNTDNVTIMEC